MQLAALLDAVRALGALPSTGMPEDKLRAAMVEQVRLRRSGISPVSWGAAQPAAGLTGARGENGRLTPPPLVPHGSFGAAANSFGLSEASEASCSSFHRPQHSQPPALERLCIPPSGLTHVAAAARPRLVALGELARMEAEVHQQELVEDLNESSLTSAYVESSVASAHSACLSAVDGDQDARSCPAIATRHVQGAPLSRFAPGEMGEYPRMQRPGNSFEEQVLAALDRLQHWPHQSESRIMRLERNVASLVAAVQDTALSLDTPPLPPSRASPSPELYAHGSEYTTSEQII